MDRRKFSRNSYLCGSVASRPAFGEYGSCPIDKVTAKAFNTDTATGRPMSDIDYIVKSRDAQAEMALFMGLNDFKSNFISQGVSDADALKYYVPRYAQTPAELADLAVKYEGFKIKEAEKAKREKDLEEYRKSFEEVKPKEEE